MFKHRVWIVAIIICLLYWATWHGYHDNPDMNYKTNPLLRHGLNFGLLLAVALAGWYGWSKHHQQWTKNLWLFIYSCVIILVVLLGVVDVLARFENSSFRSMLSSLRLFFTSPVPYGVLMYLAKRSTGGKTFYR
ncbi:hypothetical protein [Segetibacter aerophilus]|uniref:hypothetical protein n=1 Tax=Segetibacter aerophilus TaxID=670293 RepID=UPI0011BECB66|nr:hypothetical protein [Segetibacter aerophilus]